MWKGVAMRFLPQIITIGLLAFGAGAVHADEENDELPMTHEESEVLMEKCLKEDGQSCYDYAYYAARNLNNLATYRLALKRACTFHHLDACEQIEKDDKEGDEIRKKCDTGEVDSCVLYSIGRAQMYEDLIGAIHYASKACKLGHKMSCEKVKAEQAKVLDGKQLKIQKENTNEQ
jgi:hypothetical protein